MIPHIGKSARTGLIAALFCAILPACGGSNNDSNTQAASPNNGDTSNASTDPNSPQRPGSAPARMENNYAYLINNFTQGKSEPVPWAGAWWPYTANGIAAGSRGGSAAGKYDAVRGGGSNAEAWEVHYHGPHSGTPGQPVQGWWGHCNGWCAAAQLFPEPREPMTINGVEFSVSDQKALLTEVGMLASADYFGERVDWTDGTPANEARINDTAPDQLFLVLMNYIGIRKQGVNIDRHTLNEIWNQPLAAYRFEKPTPADYLGEHPNHPGIFRMNATVRLWWADDGVDPGVITPAFDFPLSNPAPGVDENDDMIGHPFVSRALRMELWLDGPVKFDGDKVASSGNLVVTTDPATPGLYAGGAWKMALTSQAWPDYMWVPFSLMKPAPEDNDHYTNSEIDLDWIKQYIAVPGDKNDPNAHSSSPRPAPSPLPAPSGGPTDPGTHPPFPGPTGPPGPGPGPHPGPGGPQPGPGPGGPGPGPGGPGPGPGNPGGPGPAPGPGGPQPGPGPGGPGPVGPAPGGGGSSGGGGNGPSH